MALADRTVVATGRLVPPSLVQSIQSGDSRNRFEQPADYFILDKPLAYIAPLLPPQSRFYQIADIAMPIMPDGKFDRRIRAALNNPPPGGAWGLHTRGKPIREQLLERYGLRVDASRRLRRNRGRVAGDRHRGVPAGCAREVGRALSRRPEPLSGNEAHSARDQARGRHPKDTILTVRINHCGGKISLRFRESDSGLFSN